MRSLPAGIIEAKNKLASEVPWLTLLELYPNGSDIVRIVNDNQLVSFGGNDYFPFPFIVGDREENGRGNLTSLTITICNVENVLSELIDVNDGFEGQKVIYRLINNGVQAYAETFRVQLANVNSREARFTVGDDDLLKVAFPTGRFYRSRCRFSYRGGLCQYVGAIATCDLSLRSSKGCEAHSADSALHPKRFAGFPGIPRS